MKTNKFRVWCKGTSNNANFNKPRWINSNDYILNKYFYCFDDLAESEDFILCQYVGMNDKNGVPIYEGDIIENVTMDEEYCSPAVVAMSVYENVGYSLYIKFRNPKDYHEQLTQEFNGVKLWEDFPLSYFYEKNYKVIGNIFENIDIFEK